MSVSVRTILLVTIVSLLIWIWSEGESLISRPVTVRIAFVDDASDLLVRTDESWRGTARVKLEGSTIGITSAEAILGAPLRLRPGQPGMPTEPGDRQIVDLTEALRGHPDIKRTGVTIVEVDPPNVVVRIVKLVRRELPVRAELPAELQIAGEATVTPAKVILRMPESAAATLPDTASAAAIVSDDDLRRLREDGPQTLPAAVRLPSSLAGVEPLTITPERVTVTIRLKKNVETVALPSVPVWVSLPPTEGTRWNVEVFDQFLRDVTITGPADLIKQIRDHQIIPIAEVRLSSDELEKSVESKEAVISGLPAGLDCTVASKLVKLKITPRPVPDKASPGRGPSAENPG